MNRQIKFRAWDDKNKKWLLGFEYPNIGGFSMFGEVMAFGEYANMLNSFSIEEWQYIILMQFTGLKDKNGKEIYEGDIGEWVSVNSNGKEFRGPKFQVEWQEGSCCNFSCTGFNLYSEESKELEIIGNIYENPELLNQ